VDQIDIEIKKIINFLGEKKFDQATLLVKRLINEKPDLAILENIYGIIFSSQNNIFEAERCFKRAIDKDKNFFNAYYNLGCTFLKKKEYILAIDYFKRTINLNSDYIDAYINLANCFFASNKHQDAIKTLEEGLLIEPRNFEILNNLGIVYKKIQEYEISIKYFNKVLEINPSFFGAYNNIGLVYHDLKKFDQAISFFNKAININNSFYDSYNNLALVYFDLNKLDVAIRMAEIAEKLESKSYSTFYILALIHEKNNDYFKALQYAQKSFDLEPLNNKLLVLLSRLYFENLYFEKGLEIFNKIDHSNIDSIELSSLIFRSLYINNFSVSEYFELINNYKKVLPKLILDDFIISNVKKDQKIKIGFISGDFRKHALSYQLLYFFEELSKKNDVEVHAYYNNDYEDELTREVKKFFNSWSDISQKSDLNLINYIRKDNLDFLVDLSGYTEKSRISIFNYRSARYQITWAGYLSSTGMEKMDFILADPYTIRIEDEKNYLEKVIRLKDVWSILSVPEKNVQISDLPFFTNGYITYGSFNNINKINPDVFRVWSQILKKTQNSRLLLKNKRLNDKKIIERIKEIFFQNNISEDKLLLESISDRYSLFDAYNRVDIALDPFPYNGMTTSFEAAWMCVPTLTKSGNTFVSRSGESINLNLNLNELIVYNDDEYIDKAVSLAKDIDKLKKIKENLKNNRESFNIFSAKNLADNFMFLFKTILKN
jgi:protein O-GlcNAc transferase